MIKQAFKRIFKKNIVIGVSLLYSIANFIDVLTVIIEFKKIFSIVPTGCFIKKTVGVYFFVDA